ncbi:MAG: hypothetical protein E7491_06165 [Ruminococcaceae bacterium]|nr:hypothetical protein [Oscillospiraceae bacterium]
MRLEDAYYFKILLLNGISDGYSEWLSTLLDQQDPLSDILLELSFCISDINKTISLLNNYCSGQPFDEKEVCDMLRKFLKNTYKENRFTKEEIISLMHRFVSAHAAPCDFDYATWGDMFYIDDYYSLAKDGTMSMEKFDRAFFEYLEHGTTIDSNSLWAFKTEQTLLQKIKKLFKRS